MYISDILPAVEVFGNIPCKSADVAGINTWNDTEGCCLC